MPIAKLDERRRITLPKEVVEEIDAEEFVAVVVEGEGILLRPLPKDPIKALEQIGVSFRHKSIKRIRKEAYKEALRQAGG